MLNKCILILSLALAPVLSAPALPEFGLSAGGGLSLGGLFTRYTITADENTKYGPTDLKMDQSMDQFNFGAYLFFDATYAELSLDIQRGNNRYKETIRGIGGGALIADLPLEGTGSETMLGFTLLGKYPFTLRKGLLLYPLAGIEYQIALAEKRKPKGGSEYNRTEGKTEFDTDKDYSLYLWNSFFIDIGAGVDFVFRSPLFMRAEFLYSFRLQTPYETAAIDSVMDRFDISQPTLWGNPKMSGLTHGPELRLALGYRFK
jgi:opacity protein-like surface antigen